VPKSSDGCDPLEQQPHLQHQDRPAYDREKRLALSGESDEVQNHAPRGHEQQKHHRDPRHPCLPPEFQEEQSHDQEAQTGQELVRGAEQRPQAHASRSAIEAEREKGAGRHGDQRGHPAILHPLDPVLAPQLGDDVPLQAHARVQGRGREADDHDGGEDRGHAVRYAQAFGQYPDSIDERRSGASGGRGASS